MESNRKLWLESLALVSTRRCNSCGPVRRPWGSFSLNTAIQTGDEMQG